MDWDDLVTLMVLGVMFHALAVVVGMCGSVGVGIVIWLFGLPYSITAGWLAGGFRRIPPVAGAAIAVVPLGVAGFWLVPWRTMRAGRPGFEVMSGRG